MPGSLHARLHDATPDCDGRLLSYVAGVSSFGPWLAAQPAMGPIIAGATSPAQIQANAAAVEWSLSGDDLAAIDAILAAHTPAE